MCVYVYINGSITISYRCNQWWVSIKVFAWRLKGGKTLVGGLRRGGMHRYSFIHGRSVRRRCGVQTYTQLQNTASPTSTLTFLGLDTWGVCMHFISFDVSGPLRWSPWDDCKYWHTHRRARTHTHTHTHTSKNAVFPVLPLVKDERSLIDLVCVSVEGCLTLATDNSWLRQERHINSSPAVVKHTVAWQLAKGSTSLETVRVTKSCLSVCLSVHLSHYLPFLSPLICPSPDVLFCPSETAKHLSSVNTVPSTFF